MNVSDFQNATISLSREVPGQDALGGNTAAQKSLLTGIIACVQPASGGAIFDYGRRGVQIDTTIYVDQVDFLTASDSSGNAINDLQENDLITDDAGIKYTVLGFVRQYQPQITDTPMYQIHTKRRP